MSGYILFILLLAIWNVILFYGNELGISVIFFVVPLLSFILYFFKKNNLKKKKKGLLFIIPIVLLSLTFMLFESDTFTFFNCLAIPILFVLLYIYTIKPVDRFTDLLSKSICLFILPISYIGKFFRVSTSKISGKLKMSPKTKKVLISCLIVLPIAIIIISLLSSADSIFSNLIDTLFGNILDFLERVIFDNFFGRFIVFLIVFFAIGTTMMYVLYEFSKKELRII